MWLFKPNVAGMLQRRDVPGLIKALAHKDGEVRKGAAGALGKIGDASAVEPLWMAVNRDSSEVREAAVDSLITLGNPGLTKLCAALAKCDSSVQRMVSQRLTQKLVSGTWDDIAKTVVQSLALARQWQCLAELAVEVKDSDAVAEVSHLLEGCNDRSAVLALANRALSDRATTRELCDVDVLLGCAPTCRPIQAEDILKVCDKATVGEVVAATIFEANKEPQLAVDVLTHILGAAEATALVQKANVHHVVERISKAFGDMAMGMSLGLMYKSWNWQGDRQLEAEGNAIGGSMLEGTKGNWTKIVATVRQVANSHEPHLRKAALLGVVEGLKKAKDNLVVMRDEGVDFFLTLVVRDIPELRLSKQQLAAKIG